MDFVEVPSQPKDVDRRRKNFGLNDSGSRELKVAFCNVDIACEVEHTAKRLSKGAGTERVAGVYSAAFLNSTKYH
jgi:hypothetical protein